MPQAYGTSIACYFNTTLRKLCDASGTPLPVGYDRVKLTSFGKYVLKMTFLDGDGAAAPDWSGQVAFWAAVDNNYDHATAGYVTVLDAAFNVAGDWQVLSVDQPDPEAGLLCCRIDLSDSRLNSNLAAQAGANYDLEIHGLRSGEANASCILRIPLYIENVQQVEAGTPEPDDDDIWVSHTEFPGLIAAKANLAAVRHVFWPAPAAVARTTAGAAAGTAELGTNDVMKDGYDFDTASDEAVQLSGYLEHWNAGTIKVKPAWTAASGSGTVCWSVAARAYADSDALDQAFGTPQTSTDTLLTAEDEHVGPATAAITVAGTPANGQRLTIQITRDVSEDDLGVDATLLGIWIEYTEADTEEAAW